MASTCLCRVGISGLVVEYVVAIDVTRVRFPADALSFAVALCKPWLFHFDEVPFAVAPCQPTFRQMCMGV